MQFTCSIRSNNPIRLLASGSVGQLSCRSDPAVVLHHYAKLLFIDKGLTARLACNILF